MFWGKEEATLEKKNIGQLKNKFSSIYIIFVRAFVHFPSAITAITTGKLLNAQQQFPAPPGGSTIVAKPTCDV